MVTVQSMSLWYLKYQIKGLQHSNMPQLFHAGLFTYRTDLEHWQCLNAHTTGAHHKYNERNSWANVPLIQCSKKTHPVQT